MHSRFLHSKWFALALLLLPAFGCIAAGATDPDFAAPVLGTTVYDILALPSGDLVVGSNAAASVAVPSGNFAKLTSAGAVANGFAQTGGGANALVSAVARGFDGKIFIAGKFTSVHGVTRKGVARLNADGTLDATFDPGNGPDRPAAIESWSRSINAMLVLPDGKVLVGGDFLNWSGQPYRGLVRLNADGSLDTTFAKLTSTVTFFDNVDEVLGLALQPLPTEPYYGILVGGLFYLSSATYPGGNHAGIVRLNLDGTRDPSFNPPNGAHANGSPNTISAGIAIAPQADGKILVGGRFTGFNAKQAGLLARLNSDGTNDASFIGNMAGGMSGGLNQLYDVVVQPDGKILTAGFFTKAGGATQSSLARWNSDGTRDSTFVHTLGNASGCASVALQSDGNILVGMFGATGGHATVLRLLNDVAGPGGQVQLATAAAEVTEGHDVTLTVDRVGGSTGKLAVAWTTVNGTASSPLDFSATAGMLTWIDGDSAPKTINLSVPTNGVVSGDSYFDVRLFAPASGTLLGDQTSCRITVHNADTVAQPLFAYMDLPTNTAAEANATVNVKVSLSSAPAASVSVPFVVSGTATTTGATKDCTVSASPLVFAAGETTKSITVAIVADTLFEGDETVIVTLQTPTSGGTALNESRKVHTLKIHEIAAKPVITAHPVSQLAAIGQASVSFSAASDGIPAPTVQWLRNNAVVAGAAANTLMVNTITIASAATYNYRATNVYDKATSNAAELAVVDTHEKTYIVPGPQLVMPVVTAGKGIAHQWYYRPFATLAVPNPVMTLLQPTANVLNPATKSITVKGLTTLSSGDYICRVSDNVSPTPHFLDVVNHVKVVDNKPVILTPVTMPEAIVSETYSFQIPVQDGVNITPATFGAVPLPAGLKIDPLTGIISGKPLVASPPLGFPITLSATNGIGPTTYKTFLVVKALALPLAGAYTGIIDRESTLNPRGGRLDITSLAATGIVTGKVTLGVNVYPFVGPINSDSLNPNTPSAVISVARKGLSSLILTLHFNALSTLITSGTVEGDGQTATLHGWHTAVPSARLKLGYYTFGLKPPVADSKDVPQGWGYGSFTIAATGVCAITGKLADGTAFASTVYIGPGGQLFVYQMLYTNKGSVHGELALTSGIAIDFSDNTITGNLNWTKDDMSVPAPLPTSVTARYYMKGFTNVSLALDGARYLPVPATAIVLGLTDTDTEALSFSSANVGEVGDSPNVTVQLKKGGSIGPISNNPRTTKLVAAPASGLLSGSFRLVDINPHNHKGEDKTTAFAGMIVRLNGVQQGVGYFLLQQFATGDQTTLQTPFFSGMVSLQKNPSP